MSVDLKPFGAALKALREARDIQQKELISRIPLHYGTERAYRRVESGERRPDRDVVIDILIKGLLETDCERIDQFLRLAGYEELSTSEQTVLGFERPVPVEQGSPEPAAVPVTETEQPHNAANRWPILFYAGIISGSLMLAVIIAATADGLPVWFTVITSSMYSALYAVSILLETAYQTEAPRALGTAVGAACMMLISSVCGLTLDAWIVKASGEVGIGLCLAVFLAAATGQFVGVRNRLPPNSIVEVSFQPHTAQAAHLKNTIYFLSTVLFFWLPTVHTILVIEREIRVGNRRIVASIFNGGGAGYGTRYVPASWLWILLIIVLGVTLLMRGQLLDNLKPHPRRNRYLLLFYTRALLYSALSFICLAWYSYSLDRIAHALMPPG